MNQTLFKYKVFGRSRGRKKRNALPQEDLKKYYINLDKDLNISDYNIIDIGSGSGENSISLSLSKPYAKIISCEIFEDGNINLCNDIIKNKITNIKIFKGNILEFFNKILVNHYFDEIWILYPDPWPKQRHHKRRLISNDFLTMICSYLKKNARLFIATDSQTYLKYILSNIYDHKNIYKWENQYPSKWFYEYQNLPTTKFFKKAQKSNRKSIFIQLKKI